MSVEEAVERLKVIAPLKEEASKATDQAKASYDRELTRWHLYFKEEEELQAFIKLSQCPPS